MAQLPLEIWGLVAGQVYAAGEIKDLLSLCLVSRDFHDVAAAWLYRSLILEEKQLQLLAERLTSRTACHVRECSFDAFIINVDDSQLRMLRSVVQRLPTLRRFKWNHIESIPEPLLEDLNRMESLLEFDLTYRLNINSGHMFSSTLNGNMKLTSLVLYFPRNIRDLGSSQNSALQGCQNVISRAPALKSLTILIDRFVLGLSAGLSFSPDELFPPLETLVLENYPLGGDDPNGIENRLDAAKLGKLCLRGVRLEGLNMFIRTLSTQQMNLKHFTVQDRSWSETSSVESWTSTLDHFLKSFVGLKSLVLQGDCGYKLPSLSAIINHCETLQCLYVHSPQIFQFIPRKFELGTIAEKLQSMSKTCLHLHELTLDLERDEQSSGLLHSIEQSLRDFPSLRTLVIYTQPSPRLRFLPISDDDKLYAEDLAARICSPRLMDVTVWMGEAAWCNLVNNLTSRTEL